jgi:hypothetical protein
MKQDSEVQLVVGLFATKDKTFLSTEDLEKLGGEFYRIGNANWCDTPIHSYREIEKGKWKLEN